MSQYLYLEYNMSLVQLLSKLLWISERASLFFTAASNVSVWGCFQKCRPYLAIKAAFAKNLEILVILWHISTFSCIDRPSKTVTNLCLHSASPRLRPLQAMSLKTMNREIIPSHCHNFYHCLENIAPPAGRCRCGSRQSQHERLPCIWHLRINWWICHSREE